MKRYGIVYKITNMITGKEYVGQTIQTIEQRFSQHCRDARSGRHLYNTIHFYGKENFSITELITCSDIESLNYYETLFIKSLKTFTPNGYNLCLGGNQKGEVSDETRKKQSKAHKGKAYRKNAKWSNESRLNFSKVQGGKPIVSVNLTTGKKTYYNYIQEACNAGFENSCIYYVLKGKRKSHKNHTFYYANQSGSVESKNSSHAQRIEVDPTIVE